MISILIVEDNKYKSEKINKLLCEDLMINSEYIDIVENIKDAKRLLIQKTYDLAILDLVLPLENGDDPSPEKGIGFLRDLETNPSLSSPIHIIGLTEFHDLQSQYRQQFELYLWHLINYDASEINWQEKLKNYVYHLISAMQKFYDSLSVRNVFDVAVITALNKPEFEKLFEWPISWEKFSIENDPSVYYKATMEKSGRFLKIVAVCVEQMGMTATAVVTTKIIHHFSPKYIIMGGICAGLKERDVNYGDIIIADQSWDYGSGKMKDHLNGDIDIKETIFEPDPRPIQLSASLKAKINSFIRRNDILSRIQNECKYNKPNYVLSAKLGPVASGSYVISSAAKLAEVKATQRKLLGIEMEGYGLYYACDHSQDQSVKGVMIKSVSDFGDSTKNDIYQEYSSYTSAWFIYYFILEELF